MADLDAFHQAPRRGSGHGAWGDTWPDNAWLITSVEDQVRADERIPLLLATEAPVKGLSVEPLIEPVTVPFFTGYGNCACGYGPPSYLHDPRCHPEPGPAWGNLDWVIVGGESGSGQVRPMHPAWVRSLLSQTQRAGAAFWLKQWGAWGPAPCGSASFPGRRPASTRPAPERPAPPTASPPGRTNATCSLARPRTSPGRPSAENCRPAWSRYAAGARSRPGTCSTARPGPSSRPPRTRCPSNGPASPAPARGQASPGPREAMGPPGGLGAGGSVNAPVAMRGELPLRLALRPGGVAIWCLCGAEPALHSAEGMLETDTGPAAIARMAVHARSCPGRPGVLVDGELPLRVTETEAGLFIRCPCGNETPVTQPGPGQGLHPLAVARMAAHAKTCLQARNTTAEARAAWRRAVPGPPGPPPAAPRTAAPAAGPAVSRNTPPPQDTARRTSQAPMRVPVAPTPQAATAAACTVTTSPRPRAARRRGSARKSPAGNGEVE